MVSAFEFTVFCLSWFAHGVSHKPDIASSTRFAQKNNCLNATSKASKMIKSESVDDIFVE